MCIVILMMSVKVQIITINRCKSFCCHFSKFNQGCIDFFLWYNIALKKESSQLILPKRGTFWYSPYPSRARGLSDWLAIIWQHLGQVHPSSEYLESLVGGRKGKKTLKSQELQNATKSEETKKRKDPNLPSRGHSSDWAWPMILNLHKLKIKKKIKNDVDFNFWE